MVCNLEPSEFYKTCLGCEFEKEFSYPTFLSYRLNHFSKISRIPKKKYFLAILLQGQVLKKYTDRIKKTRSNKLERLSMTDTSSLVLPF